VDRHLADADPASLGAVQQLGVEEPLFVGDVVEQVADHLCTPRLEPALGVREAGAQREVQEDVVGA
jgi:hypothetical protein